MGVDEGDAEDEDVALGEGEGVGELHAETTIARATTTPKGTFIACYLPVGSVPPQR